MLRNALLFAARTVMLACGCTMRAYGRVDDSLYCPDCKSWQRVVWK
jgi:hypothetical protein